MKRFINKKHHVWLQLTCIVLLLCSLSACTYDYFVDETNYYLYVPQMEDGTIDNITVVMFDNSDKLVWVKQYTQEDYAQNATLRSGLIKIQVIPGDYTVSCYSGTQNSDKKPLLNTTTVNKSATINTAYVSLFESSVKDIYLNASDFKVIDGGKKRIKVPFLNQRFEADGVTPIRNRDTLKLTQHCGTIHVSVQGIKADDITRVDMLVNSISTRWRLDGKYEVFTPNDKVNAMHDPTTTTLADGAEKRIEFAAQYFPSLPETNLSANFYFTFKDGTRGDLTLSEERFKAIAGMSSTEFSQLLPNGHIYITIKDLVIVGISLKGWDDNIQGGGDEDM